MYYFDGLWTMPACLPGEVYKLKQYATKRYCNVNCSNTPTQHNLYFGGREGFGARVSFFQPYLGVSVNATLSSCTWVTQKCLPSKFFFSKN